MIMESLLVVKGSVAINLFYFWLILPAGIIDKHGLLQLKYLACNPALQFEMPGDKLKQMSQVLAACRGSDYGEAQMGFAGLKKKCAEQAGTLWQNIKRLRHVKFKFDYPSRIRWAVAVLVFFSLLSSWGLFKANRKDFSLDFTLSGQDSVALYERRFVEAKKVLPAHGVVGYVSDAQGGAEFFLTQYTLAPLIVDLAQPHELVIGNFVNRAVDVTTLTKTRLTLRRDFGNGVKLFSVESR